MRDTEMRVIETDYPTIFRTEYPANCRDLLTVIDWLAQYREELYKMHGRIEEGEYVLFIAFRDEAAAVAFKLRFA